MSKPTTPAIPPDEFQRMTMEELTTLQLENPELYAASLAAAARDEPALPTSRLVDAPAPEGVIPYSAFTTASAEDLMQLQLEQPEVYARTVRHWRENVGQVPIPLEDAEDDATSDEATA